jgi:two-component system chemotaxis sensor kinase CheA
VNPLLEQFISESRDVLQGIAQKLMQLENEPASSDLMTELFRLVHTLKGNSGLFDLPELTRVLHAGEDLMDAVRNGKVAYSLDLADCLLDATDFVGMLCDEIEANGCLKSSHGHDSVRLAEALRKLIVVVTVTCGAVELPEVAGVTILAVAAHPTEILPLQDLPEETRMAAYRSAVNGEALHWIAYNPVEDCFFTGDDPFHQARQTPGIVWGSITARTSWPKLADLDPYCCLLDFAVLSSAPFEELEEYYRYVADQVRIIPVPRHFLILPQGDHNGEPVYEDFVAEALGLLQSGNSVAQDRAARSMLELSNPDLWLSAALRWLLLVSELEPENSVVQKTILESLRTLTPPDWHEHEPDCGKEAAADPQTDPPAAEHHAPLMTPEVAALVAVQREILTMPDDVAWLGGRIMAAAAALSGCLSAIGADKSGSGLETALDKALGQESSRPLLQWLDTQFSQSHEVSTPCLPPVIDTIAAVAVSDRSDQFTSGTSAPPSESEIKFGRRSEDSYTGPKSIKVDQIKIDRLMNLIGEMVVAKNALPYLAGRAESVFGVRELSREIRSQYAVINRIAEEMQDSIMQVRMMPVSFVLQRFPRLVRDTSNKLGKEVNLVLEGEETEADKNVIESLGDPLVHIVRNSLDHGIELPDIRKALGKPAAGTLVIRATQEADRVIIEIRDDGKGIDPEVIKRKAYEKGIIDEERLERITDQEAVNLVFAAGFSTAEVVSDLSGRGVGMDVVRTAVEKVNGSITLESEKGKGTRICLSLPLSMAVSNVMIVESNNQFFGVPMERVVETVRIPRSDIRTIKKSQATVLRGRIVPLKSLNILLGQHVPPRANEDDELAVLIVSLGSESVGILVDGFRETVDIILKPMTGVLAGLSAYAGSALLGDGSVLMVLDVKELI